MVHAIEFCCPKCRAPYKVGRENAGRRVRCKACNQGIIVPAGEEATAEGPCFATRRMMAIRGGIVCGLPLLAGIAFVLLGPRVHPDDVVLTIFNFFWIGAIGLAILVYLVEVVLSYTMPIPDPEGRGSFVRSGSFTVAVVGPTVSRKSVVLALGGVFGGYEDDTANVWTKTDQGWADKTLQAGKRYRIVGRKLWTTGDTMILVNSAAPLDE